VWVDHFKEDLGDVDLSDLKYLTNLIPLELGQFLRTNKNSKPGTSFPDVLQMYRQDRMATLRKRHINYFVKLDVDIRRKFLNAAKRLYLGLGCGETAIFDRQLMYYHQGHFRAITPLAFQVHFEENNALFG